MGPKSKSKALLQHQQKCRELANLTLSKNRMDDKINALKSNLAALNGEVQSLTFLVQTKNCELSGLREEISNLDYCLTENQNTKANLSSSLCLIKNEVSCLNKELDNERRKLVRKRNLISDIQQNIKSAIISSRAVAKRNPYSFENRYKVSRCKEVLQASSLILGGSDTNMQPVLNGMLDTVTRNFSISDVLKAITISKEKKLQKLNQGFATSYNNAYFISDENKFRSLSTYYAHDILGKRKYLAMRKANRKSIFRAERIPNYVSYSVLSSYINSVDIGPLKPLYSDDQVKVVGIYRDLRTFVPRLASFYLHVNELRNDKLMNFEKFPRKNQTSFLFLLSFGGDGAPGVGTIFNISFLNAGKRIMSSSETFTIFGGDFNETSDVVRNYVLDTVQDFRYLEKNIFPIPFKNSTINVEFKFAEFPNDMKFLYFLAGELSNKAKFFTTFANVSSDDMRDVTKSFGPQWKAWDYSKRIADSIKVAEFKKTLKSNVTCETNRNKIRAYIKGTLISRQEFKPLLEEYIDLAKCEPLHLKNNVCQDYFNKVLLQICSLKLTKVKLFKELPSDDIFCVLVTFVKSTMKLNLLSKKLVAWFNETKRTEKDFSFRFRGEESYGFLKCFPTLFQFFLPYFEAKGESFPLPFMRLFRQLLCVRKLISYSVRVHNFNQEDLDNMMSASKVLKKYICLETSSVKPSLWVLCQIAPYHAKKTLELYGLGLGVNSMEPREQKHQRIKKYSENTTHQDKWKMIFRHEYMQLIFLWL